MRGDLAYLSGSEQTPLIGGLLLKNDYNGGKVGLQWKRQERQLQSTEGQGD